MGILITNRASSRQTLQALRGVSLLTAVNMVAEIGAFNRFQNPKELMAYLGFVPSEHSSGDRIRRGGITKTGNSHARRICVESAWPYRYQARITQLQLKRHEGFQRDVLQIAWKGKRPAKKLISIEKTGFITHRMSPSWIVLFLSRLKMSYYLQSTPSPIS